MPKINFAQWGNDLYTGRRSYNVVGKRRVFFTVSAVIIAVCVGLMFFPGLELGIDFRGGSEFRVITTQSSIETGPATEAVESVAAAEVPRVTKVGAGSLRIQTQELSNDDIERVKSALAEAYDLPVDSITSNWVGPTWGRDVSTKAFTGAGIFMVLVMIAMTFYFRAWRMAVSAIAALAHDLIVTIGVYAVVGFEITPASVIGFLTVLGYSLYDTVVVFDKVRENTAAVLDQSQFTYAEGANLAVNQTMVRSINTSVVALLPVGSILFIGAFLLGAGTLRDISLALFVGMIAGTYSSIFLATPMEVALRSNEKRIREHTAKVLARRATSGDDTTSVSRLTPIGAIRPGVHQGQAAQPRRRPRKDGR
ncbi:MAG: protein translocase subunit SecF [Bifidobacteriaceae bacterium]|jgi:preprotein translocase subunit SecF|nr:protein translocase subunit SecF [Bifidobacteriaceae bacterium]